ncbi:ATP-dependent DNA helicase, partial [Veillonellaceae bacterium M2-4]|nr:ATP-dependent DNA helicase [Veillonellaceae bacterium M2-4]
KIAFPTLPSYRLSDLTHSLNLKHTNPHPADSDAYATASLLLKIFDKLETLPQSTLNTLTSLSKGLLRDTQFIFKEISEFTRQEKRPLPKKYRQVHSLVLKKQDQVLHSDNAKKAIFPKSDEDKKQLFKGKLE